MSILIKNMDMPKNCCECFAFKSSMSGYFLCKASGIAFGKEDAEWLPLKTPDWCPLVEVKTPHGDLIDKRNLFKQAPGKMTHFHDGIFDWEIRNAPKWLKENAPTVIESEE